MTLHPYENDTLYQKFCFSYLLFSADSISRTSVLYVPNQPELAFESGYNRI
jgi:hypothetical protein